MVLFILFKQLLLSMSSFSLRNNNIGSKGARFMSEALKMNQVLVSVKWVSIFKKNNKNKERKKTRCIFLMVQGGKLIWCWCCFEPYSSASKTIQLRRRELRLLQKCCSPTASWCLSSEYYVLSPYLISGQGPSNNCHWNRTTFSHSNFIFFVYLFIYWK